MVEADRAAVESLAVLNEMFAGWLKDYHNRVHSELQGKTPMQRWTEDSKRRSSVGADEVSRALMLRARRRININTATVSVDGRDYQASPDLAGQEVEVRWSVQNTSSVELWMLGEFIETALEFKIKSYVERRERELEPDEAPGTPIESSKKLMAGYQSSQPDVALGGQQVNDLLACSEFVKLFRKSLDRELIQEELDMLGAFFLRVAPIRREVVVTTLERSVQVKGGDLHLRFYLEQVEQGIHRR